VGDLGVEMCKWGQLMKKIESTKGKYTHFCCETIVLSNYLHKCYMDFTYEVIGNQIQTQLIGSYSYKYNNSPTLALNSTSVKIPISLIALKLTSLTFFTFLCSLAFLHGLNLYGHCCHLHLLCHGGKVIALHFQHFIFCL
jgi:hypothetical protein